MAGVITAFSLVVAQTGSGSDALGGGLMTMGIFVLFIAVFYFLLIRPSQKQRKEHDRLVQDLNKGDAVTTAGGIHGTITQVKEDYVMLEIAKKTEVKVSRSSIARRETEAKGGAKSPELEEPETGQE